MTVKDLMEKAARDIEEINSNTPIITKVDNDCNYDPDLCRFNEAGVCSIDSEPCTNLTEGPWHYRGY